MLKQIIIIIFSGSFLLCQDFQAIYDGCDSNHTDLEYFSIMFTDLGYPANKFTIIDISACDISSSGWDSGKSLYCSSSGTFSHGSEGIYRNGTLNDFNDFKADILFHNETSTVTSVDEYLIDLYLESSDSSYAFVYGDKGQLSTSVTFTTQEADSLDNWVDSLSLELGNTITQPDYSNLTSEKAFLVDLEVSNTFASGYSQSELSYILVFDDGSNVFERIEDTDRSNELVGFRYYCDRNSIMYTKFIKPNN